MGHYVYKYVLNNECLYIGKTDKDLKVRLSQHGKPGDNIASDYWDEINKAKVYYCEFADRHMTDIYETELIRRHNPKYNKAKKSEWSGINLPEPVWCIYHAHEDLRLRDEINSLKEENKHLKSQVDSLVKRCARCEDVKSSELQLILDEHEKALNKKCENCPVQEKMHNFQWSLYYGIKYGQSIPILGTEFFDVLELYKSSRLLEPYISVSLNPFGAIECIKAIFKYGNSLEFVFNQAGCCCKSGAIFYGTDDDTKKNWDVLRSYVNRGSKSYFPLSYVYKTLNNKQINSAIDEILKTFSQNEQEIVAI